MSERATGRPETLLGFFLANARTHPRATAWRIKRRGAWRQTSWADAARDVARVGAALEGVGVERGATVAIVGDWEPELLLLDLAVHGLGGKPVVLSPTLTADELARVLSSDDVSVVLSTDATVVQELGRSAGPGKVVAVRGAFRNPAAAARGPAASALSLEEMLSAELPDAAGALAAIERSAATRGADDVAFVGFTPGTSGPSRRLEFSERGVVAAAAAMIPVAGLTPRDRVLCYHPLSHPLGRILGAYGALVAGASINFLESGDTAVDDMAELAPTAILSPPRFPELLHAVHQRQLQASRGLRRRMMAGSEGRGSFTGRLIRSRLGLRETRWFGCLGPISERMRVFFRPLGIALSETYALTDAGGLVCHETAPGRLSPVDGVEVKTGDDGHLSVRTPWPVPGANGGGWIETGDVAEVDASGAVRILGRASQVVERDGRRIPLESLERAIADSPYVRAALVSPSDGAGVRLLVEPDFESVRLWTEQHDRVVFSGNADLSRHPAVVALIEAEARGAAAPYEPEVTVEDVQILPRELTVERMERTVTGHLRREVVIGSLAAS